ncbi:unnamed protein product (macronuclear) [Paramecium tetraurelia]|uniref:Ubiquitin-like protease family profile domain-containing protein n=1 Tax=Paramecium tetraurelia TaxID=5888 RepID=A0E230_PARTE|nr:uncharacterized protein GSPATT00022518001 [Paramecium tetraurelia]CAK89347.1 unnamed protein product [Paramecium tetraurelia]|eukprot:XP_001456744.1 hypothetical protein (macronuclear) [Paramecium tetraurelia strain d4-2]
MWKEFCSFCSLFNCIKPRDKRIEPERPQIPDDSEEVNNQDIKNNNRELQNQPNVNINEEVYITRKFTYFEGFEKVEIKNDKYDKLMIFTNILFYYCEERTEQNQFNQYEGELYKTKYDEDINPKFVFEQGMFQINLEEKSFKLIQESIEQPIGITEDFDEKSNNLMNDQNDRFQDNNKRKIRINDADTHKQVNINHSGDNYQLHNQKKNQQMFCKFNQSLTTNDVNILSEKKWMTSSIIDSYVLYLNKSGEEKYFALQQEQRKSIRRILFFPSSLTTNFGLNFDLSKVKGLFDNEKPQFKQINFKLQLLYHYIGFPINKNNNHWLFLLFDLNSKKVFVFDSMNKNLSFKEQIDLIAEILNVKNPKHILHQHSDQQKDGYSCGYRVCSLMKFYYENQFQETDEANYKYNEQKIIDELKTLIKM